MKTPLMLWLCAVGFVTCAAADLVRPTESPATWVDPADPTVAAVRRAGERAIERVGQQMILEVQRAVSAHGVAGAVSAVHLKNLPLPDSEPGQPRVSAVRRTSLSLRNPANRPDAADQAALAFVDNALRSGSEVPAVVIQRIDRPGQPAEWRVSRPITTMPLCLRCHAAKENLATEVLEQLTRLYPADQATGYTAYQWRGLIRVSLVE